jgi:predicted homoserine dehydrogenase-like protein
VPTGQAQGFCADVAATAKRDLRPGEELDGEGGFTVYGTLLPACRSLALGTLPIGLAHRVRLRRSVSTGHWVTWEDVEIDRDDPTVRFRQEMEERFRPGCSGK